MSDEYNIPGFKRKYERKDYRKDIYYSVKSNAYQAVINNISLGGALINHDSVPKIFEGDIITINIPFSKTKQSVKRKAKVMWIFDTKFGIQFI